MFNSVTPVLPGFVGQQGMEQENLAVVSPRPTNTAKTGDVPSQIDADVKEQSPQEKPLKKSTLSVLQQKFGVSTYSYVPSNGRIFFESSNGHFYPMPSKNIAQHQSGTIGSMSFTSQGLVNMREKYDGVLGATTFLHAFLKMDKFSVKLHDMLKSPALYPYFADEKFLIMPNIPYDRTDDRHTSPKSLKLKDQGITLCGWFVHPGLSSINDETRTLLRELSQGRESAKPFIGKLRAQCATTAADASKETERDEKNIGQLKQNGEYLATILDLNASHIPMLAGLKEKTMRHIEEIYGVNKNDQVALYFHNLYEEDTTTLHLHIRVNHGLHPFEQKKSYTIDQIISGLSNGNTIDDIILARQEENGGKFLRVIPDGEDIFKDVDGVTMVNDNLNVYRLESTESVAKPIESRADLARS